MPGKRNFAKERAAHAAAAPRRQQTIYQSLREQLPEHDKALVGWVRILAHLHALGIRRRNGRPLTRRIVNRWRAHEGCPILRGNRCATYRTHPFTTVYALTAWLLSPLSTGEYDGSYRVCATLADALPGSSSPTPASRAA